VSWALAWLRGQPPDMDCAAKVQVSSAVFAASDSHRVTIPDPKATCTTDVAGGEYGPNVKLSPVVILTYSCPPEFSAQAAPLVAGVMVK
jgi:hypothetical protein